MAKLAEISGIIAGRLQLNPAFVDWRMKGLRAAGRLPDKGDVSPTGAADLLASCFGSYRNATGPAHLPFVGAVVVEQGAEDEGHVKPGNPLLEPYDMTFGQTLAWMIARTAAGRRPPGEIECIRLAGYGDDFAASIQIDGTVSGNPDMRMLLFYGYRPLEELLEWSRKMPDHIVIVSTVSGRIVDDIAAMLAGREVAPVTSVERPSAAAEVH